MGLRDVSNDSSIKFYYSSSYDHHSFWPNEEGCYDELTGTFEGEWINVGSANAEQTQSYEKGIMKRNERTSTRERTTKTRIAASAKAKYRGAFVRASAKASYMKEEKKKFKETVSEL